MKVKLIITISIIILLMVYAYLGMGYMKERKEHEGLTSQIAEITEVLREIPKPPQDLEQRLAAAQESLAAEQSVFPGEMNSTEVIDAILKIADNSELKAVPLASQPWSIENVGEHGYYVFRLNIAVEGDLSQLVSFVYKLEEGEFETLIVKYLSVTKVSEQPREEADPEDTIPVTASLDIAIYTQSQTSD